MTITRPITLLSPIFLQNQIILTKCRVLIFFSEFPGERRRGDEAVGSLVSADFEFLPPGFDFVGGL
jgi:hypothetical protein